MRHIAPRFAPGHEHSAAGNTGQLELEAISAMWSRPRLNLKQKSSPVCPESAKNVEFRESDSLFGQPLQRQCSP